jgi:hypothetical protein
MAQRSSALGVAFPWSERLFSAARMSPLALGALVAALAFGAFLLLEGIAGGLGAILRGEPSQQNVEEYRFSLVIALLIGYLPAAWIYLVRGSRRTVEALRPALRCGPAEFAALRDRAGRFDPRALRWAGILGATIALGLPFLVDLSLNVYSIREIRVATLAHRILLPVVGWLVGRFIHAVLADSARLARIGRELVAVDLLDLGPLAPFARYGLRNTLLMLGQLSIVSLLLIDWGARPGFALLLPALFALTLGVAAVGLLLPVRGAHAAIRLAKQAELAWCRHEIRLRREALTAGAGSAAAGLHEIVAYRGMIQSVREWPFDASTLTRFLLYLAIPVGSWLGGAMVERAVNTLLD